MGDDYDAAAAVSGDIIDVARWMAKDWVQRHEDAVAKQRLSMRAWLDYWAAVELRDEVTAPEAIWVLKRALRYLPRSYKLWKIMWEYLLDTKQPSGTIVAALERALWTLSAYPRVWVVYLTYLCQNPARSSSTTTHLRRTFSRALESLNVGQHDKIWALADRYLFTSEGADGEQQVERPPLLPVISTNRLWKRLCLLRPERLADYAAWCERHELWGEAANAYLTLLTNNNNDSTEAKEKDYWRSFGELVARHSVDIERIGIDWQAVLQTALRSSAAESGSGGSSSEDASLAFSWLASAWIRRGDIGMARSVYEDGLQQVSTVKDFSILFAAYIQLEESLLEQLTESIEEDEEVAEDDDKSGDDWDIIFPSQSTSQGKLAQMEFALARAEHLTQRRPVLLNAVHLRQNPNNIDAWLERADLQGKPRQAIAVLEEALVTVNRATSSIVFKLIKLYTLDEARNLLDRVCLQRTLGKFDAKEHAECWAAWVELELAEECWDAALSLARQSVAKLSHSLRLWNLLLDLEESLGTVQTTKDVYNRAIDTKMATVEHVLNFCTFLTERKYFEESYSAYEKGLEQFAFPHVGAKLLWKSYLDSFMGRYSGTKIERTRHLFQRCLANCPPEHCIEFYLMQGEFEETYGLTKRALSVYREMCEKVENKEKYAAYQLYILKTTQHLGLSSTRGIYEEALNSLQSDPSVVVKLCLDFANAEISLHQTERARLIFVHGSQFADPRKVPDFWKAWNDFEIAHGNEDTFREMLRVKRSVMTAFSTVNFNATGMTEKVQNFTDEEAMRMIASGEGVDLDDTLKAKHNSGTSVPDFVPGKRAISTLDDVEDRVAKLRKATAAQDGQDDENEIDLDDIDAEIEEAVAEGQANVSVVETRTVPDAVFGGISGNL
jgi:pre-mRNA-splicing factor SYF1